MSKPKKRAIYIYNIFMTGKSSNVCEANKKKCYTSSYLYSYHCTVRYVQILYTLSKYNP